MSPYAYFIIDLISFFNAYILFSTDKKLSKDDSFMEQLKLIFQKRKNELINQYEPEIDDELIEKKQRMLEIIFGKIPKELRQDFGYLREEFSSKDEIKVFLY